MTTAPGTLIDLQARLSRATGSINLGIVGDQAHVATGGYHIGAQSLRAAGMGGDYSLQYDLDRRDNSDFASAIDIGGTPQLLMTLGNRIVHALAAKDPRVFNRVRAVNAAFDGQSIDRRYDTEDPNDPNDSNVQACSDRDHLHLEIYRSLVTNQTVINDLFSVLSGQPRPGTAPAVHLSLEDDMKIIVGERQSLALQVRGIDDIRVLQEGERVELEACGFERKQVKQAVYDDLRKRSHA